jgi:hypothetical protein
MALLTGLSARLRTTVRRARVPPEVGSTALPYDISYPHDLRVPFNKPTMSDEEIDAYLEDPRADTDLKQQLLLLRRAAAGP